MLYECSETGASSHDFGSVTFRIRLVEVCVKKDACNAVTYITPNHKNIENVHVTSIMPFPSSLYIYP